MSPSATSSTRFGLGALALVALGCRGGGAVDPTPAPTPTVATTLDATATPSAPPSSQPPPAEPSAFERAVAERMRQVAAVTVEVDVRSSGTVVSGGSGVLISAAGDVLTAAHVVEHPGADFQVLLPNGERRSAVVVAVDARHDAAILHAAGDQRTAFTCPVARGPKAGAWVVCAGHGGGVPGDRELLRTAGLVVESSFPWTAVTEYVYDARRRGRRPSKSETSWEMLHVDCPTASGMSGGPVVDLDGNLVGVVVGTHAAASTEAIRYNLLAKFTCASSEAPGPPLAAPAAALGVDRLPSRQATLEPIFASAASSARSVFDVTSGTGAGLEVNGVIVTGDGLVVVPAVLVEKHTDPPSNIAAADILVLDRPDARCTEIVAVRGELALLRFSGLFSSAADGGAGPRAELRPVGPASAEAVGMVVANVASLRHHGGVAVGFVTALLRHPGRVAQDPDYSHHRSLWMQGRRFPPVVVDSALAHDLGYAGFGSLLVDREGRPVAIEVASRAAALGFAIPWSDVLARFDAWLAVK